MKFQHLFFLILPSCLFAASISYIHPLPNSMYHSTATTVIVRFDDSSALTDPKDVIFTLNGIDQKKINGENILSTDGRTFIFKPTKLFTPNDIIHMTITVPKINLEYSSYFYISSKSTGLQVPPPEEELEANVISSENTANTFRVINGVSVPADFPDIHVTQNAEPDDGYIFVTTYDLSINYWMILRNDGTPYFYRRRIGQSRLWDFTVQGDNLLTLVEGETAKMFDANFEQLDWFKCGHGYKTDYHEFRLTPEGHVLLIGEDVETIDMSEFVENGRPNAKVVGNLIQELDKNKNVIFEWRSWDNYYILDSHVESFTALTIHYAHINAIDIDFDGNLLISARTMDEITKVNRENGQVMWRLGGKNNEFTFVNDPDRFTYQHDIRAVPDKPNHYTLFDNGNYHAPAYSRAVEYNLDVENRTATKVWEHRHTPDYHSHWMGSVQRLPNGNTGICWALRALPNYSEVDADGNLVYEMEFEPTATSYRAHRIAWQGHARQPYLLLEEETEAITLLFNQFGAEHIAYYNVYADTVENPVTLVDSTRNTFIHLSDLVNNKTYYFRVTSVDSFGVESEFSNQQETLVQIVKPGENQILNGNFAQYTTYWVLSRTDKNIADWDVDDNGHLDIQIFTANGFSQDVQVSQRRLLIAYGRKYKLEFDAYADTNRPLDVRVMDELGRMDYSELGLLQLTMRLKHYSVEFTMLDETDKKARLFFSVGDMVGDVYIDNVYLSEVVDDVAVQSESTPQAYFVYPSFPNPFNAQTTIRYSLAKQADIHITFFDILGRALFTDELKNVPSGEHEYCWNASALSSGVYFCQLVATDGNGRIDFEDRIKLMLLK